MALNRKYSALPDLDTAPDIYETPELTDDNSTVPTTTGRSQSDNEFDNDEDGDKEISHSHLQVDQARSRFLRTNVDARDVDFSDRLDEKRKSYRTTSRRLKVLDDGTEELGDLSDDDDGDSLQRKIARLRREIEEAKEEYGKQKATSGKAAPDAATQEAELESLSQVLDEISRVPEGSIQTGRTAPTALPGQKEPAVQPAPSVAQPLAETSKQARSLAQAADFDRRLVLLEKAIGIGSSTLPELDSGGLPRAIIPTLETLQGQISTLSEASTASLDSISRRVRALTQEADQLTKSRRSAKAAQEALAQAGAAPALEKGLADDSEQTAKINALYGTLPTIESLTPLLPPLLDRLRSLRAIHADAATASESLDRIEQRQADMATEIKQWKEGLDKIEAVMKEGESAMGGNMKVIEGWVKELEERLAKLP